MKKVLIPVAFVLAMLVVAGVLFFRPVPLTVSRSVVINVPPGEAFAKVVDYNRWPIWSPWLVAEPDTKVEISGDGKSVGSIYKWNGNIVGVGEIEPYETYPTNLEVIPPQDLLANIYFPQK